MTPSTSMLRRRSVRLQWPHENHRGRNKGKCSELMRGKRDHFLPRHYLRQFRFEGTDQVAIATLDPCRYVGLGSIDRQCQEDSFYEKDRALGQILWQGENDLAPILRCVTQKVDFDSKECFALNFLAVLLHLRTKSAAEHAKVF